MTTTQANGAVISPAQEAFDKTYITAAQIMKDLGLTRGGLLYARKSGKLPDPIVVNDGRLLIWERSTVSQYLDAWNTILKARRG